MSKYILDTRLSKAQYIICTEAIRRGIIEPEDLNEGRRTMGEQTAFYRNQPPLAAFPSPFAPHIKKGFANHAIDMRSERRGESGKWWLIAIESCLLTQSYADPH